ncbi:MAG: hypothetical protein PUJ05_10740 [Clostridium sp.]|uniref:hypothetical protein n=1 Tax=Clostridium sp. TaxID=1506 RepID=UPI0026733BBF|nr:hypothetical protein [Clostridium sp.]MCI7030874.1 hypothetical protein [Clostridium sp.]MDD7683402.1 hypothetical protein [Clostridium sp.]MDY2580831.1 hypothetical protein [Clostridium sp.]
MLLNSSTWLTLSVILLAPCISGPADTSFSSTTTVLSNSTVLLSESVTEYLILCVPTSNWLKSSVGYTIFVISPSS